MEVLCKDSFVTTHEFHCFESPRLRSILEKHYHTSTDVDPAFYEGTGRTLNGHFVNEAQSQEFDAR